MNDFFSTIFYWFSSMFNQGWDNFLYDNGVYTYFGLILLAFPAIIAASFYYAPTVRLHGRLKWFLFMLLAFVLVFAITFGIGDYFLQYTTDLDQYDEITTMDEIGTAFIGGFWGIVWYTLLSLIMMLTSTHNYKVPFNS